MFSAFQFSRKISRLCCDLQQFSEYHYLNLKVRFLRRSRDAARNVLIRRAFPLPIFLLILRVKIPRRSLYEHATYLTVFHGSQADKVVLSFRASFVNTLIRRWDSSFSSTNSNNPVYGDISYERR